MRRRRPEPFRSGGAPTRTPGDRGIRLAPAAGDLQLPRRLRKPGTARQTIREEPAESRLHRVGDVAPCSGVYNLVDTSGRYLGHQIAWHRGLRFPPSRDRALEGRDYRYELELKAADLHRGEIGEREQARTIHRPGETVPLSGVYSVVDERGDELGHQHALAEGRTFRSLEAEDPRAHGYVLDYQARHLDDAPQHD
jgi:hypothetical protein